MQDQDQDRPQDAADDTPTEVVMTTEDAAMAAEDATGEPVTILALAKYRLGLGREVSSLSGADFTRASLPIMGGCQRCEATIAAYNACPSKTGYLMCADSCIGDLGYATVQEANEALFGESEAELSMPVVADEDIKAMYDDLPRGDE